MTSRWSQGTLFKRTFRLRYLSELPEDVKKRLFEASLVLRREEDNLRDLLDLTLSPRLSLVDEESASLVTGREREALEQERDDQNEREQAEEKARKEEWRGGKQ